MKFRSPTFGVCNIDRMIDIILHKIRNRPDSEWTVAIGTDSQNKGNITRICSAIIVIEKGKGGSYFYSKNIVPRIMVLQQRMLKEAEISINIGHKIIETIENKFINGESDILDYNVELEIHCDFGNNGKSKGSIAAALGWITAEFGGQISAKIKPDSLAASCIADKYTK